MQGKKLTIIIPHYNSCELARKLLDSIPRQEDIQVILVDDNSTEDVTDLRQYAMERHVEFYKSDSDMHSAGHCRNIALRHAIGEWLLFADADDFFLEGFYDLISPYFEKEYDIVYFPPTSIKLSDGRKSRRHVVTYHLAHNYAVAPTWENEALLRYKWVFPVSRIIRRSMVVENNILFDETKVSNDVMFAMQCAVHAGRIQACDERIYCITEQDGTLSKLEDRENVHARLRIAVRRYKYLKKNLDKKTWRFLDFRGDKYIKLIKRYPTDTWDILWAWGYMLINGIRPCISRELTIRNLIPKLVNKIFGRKRHG